MISIVIPVFNEAERLPATLPQILASATLFGESVEVIVVDDGSSDGTAQYLSDQAARHPALRVIRSELNRGKGGAVRDGVLHSKGDPILVTDADLSTPLEEAPALFARLNERYELSFGIRPPGNTSAVRRTWMRDIGGRTFRRLVNLTVLPRATDTQCGFKAFSRKAALDLFGQLSEFGFLYDVEIYQLARKKSMRIAEVPVSYRDVEGSKITLADSIAMFRGLFRLRRRHKSTAIW